MHVDESCSDDAAVCFDVVLDAVTGRDPSRTDYISKSRPCVYIADATITKKRLVEWEPAWT
jgi:hypothetical protein